ncbi:SRPBCC family protein [Streptomyces sanglieri]|uniref:SRPBCC family protein n=1 Tax=Streptomyces sanglieri TaxID=193460 RepID=UPI003524D41A
MAHINKEFLIDNSPENVWEALREVGAVHQRLVPGFVTDTRMEADTRIVTFANGVVVHELIVDIDEASRRVAYAVVGGAMAPKHHQASMQVLADTKGRSRFVWTIDVTPDELVAPSARWPSRGCVVARGAARGRRRRSSCPVASFHSRHPTRMHPNPARSRERAPGRGGPGLPKPAAGPRGFRFRRRGGEGQAGLMFSAWGPFWPWVTSNVTT